MPSNMVATSYGCFSRSARLMPRSSHAWALSRTACRPGGRRWDNGGGRPESGRPRPTLQRRPRMPAASTARSDALRALSIPQDLLPADGRFGSGPSRIRSEQMDALQSVSRTVLGTSHRQAPVKDQVARIRQGLTELFSLPEGYEVVLGNGGSTAFWDIAACGLVERRAQHLVIGEFSQKFATETAAAPHLEEPETLSAAPGTITEAVASEDVDAYAWPHNETSTGVMVPVRRPVGVREDQLVLVAETSVAGAAAVDISQTDAYYFAPQKAFASDGRSEERRVGKECRSRCVRNKVKK